MKNRRDFLKTSLVGLGALSYSPFLSASPAVSKFPKRFVLKLNDHNLSLSYGVSKLFFHKYFAIHFAVSYALWEERSIGLSV